MTEARHKLRLVFPWREQDIDEVGVEALELETRYALEHYGELPGVEQLSRSRSTVRHWIASARSVIAFMDVTDLRIASAPKRLFNDEAEEEHLDVAPEIFDHTRYWQDAGGALLITTEPYDGDLTVPIAGRTGKPAKPEQIAAWCREKNWACEILPPGIGLWNPEGGTRLLLISPAPGGAALKPLVPLLLETMPRATQVH